MSGFTEGGADQYPADLLPENVEISSDVNRVSSRFDWGIYPRLGRHLFWWRRSAVLQRCNCSASKLSEACCKDVMLKEYA